MTYAAKIIADSIAHGVRLTTMEIVFPRIVLSEFNTHRMLSRNSASSRAIPVKKRIEAVRENPFIPEGFGRNQKGMQALANLDQLEAHKAKESWMRACENAITEAERLEALGVHKQLANRLLEPFSWHTVVVTATEWENYFALRCSSLAQPEIRIVSELMEAAMKASTPVEKKEGEWHLPYVRVEDVTQVVFDDDFFDCSIDDTLVKISSARCARVSYLTHDGRRAIKEDIKMYGNLRGPGHMSPFEHPAKVVLYDNGQIDTDMFVGNFRAPWVQHRKQIEGEAVAKREA